VKVTVARAETGSGTVFNQLSVFLKRFATPFSRSLMSARKGGLTAAYGSLGFGAFAIAGIAAVLAGTTSRDVVIPLEEAKFNALSSSELYLPGGATLSTTELWSDPATGRGSYLLKWTKGPIRRHTHTNDYQLVVLKGVLIHRTEGLPQSVEKRLSVGGYYFQPGGGVHAETCLTDECITLSTFFGKPDTKVVEDPKVK
jgi:hypothetical protein